MRIANTNTASQHVFRWQRPTTSLFSHFVVGPWPVTARPDGAEGTRRSRTEEEGNRRIVGCGGVVQLVTTPVTQETVVREIPLHNGASIGPVLSCRIVTTPLCPSSRSPPDQVHESATCVQTNAVLSFCSKNSRSCLQPPPARGHSPYSPFLPTDLLRAKGK